VFHIDVFAMRFWRSGIGLRRIAYEVKCSRADFWQEVKRPQKRQRAEEISHQFYFVAPKHLIQPSEIPEGCGLVEYEAGRTRMKLEAPLREPRWLEEQEVLYLLRRDLFRSKTPQLLQHISNLRYANEQLRHRLREAQEEIRQLQAV
jgi:hypothetical protein